MNERYREWTFYVDLAAVLEEAVHLSEMTSTYTLHAALYVTFIYRLIYLLLYRPWH